MYLFNKRTRNLIKILWGIFAVLIIVSMVITYSGFTMLARTDTSEPIEVTREDLQYPEATPSLDVNSLSTTSPELQPLFESIRKDMESTDDGATPPPQEPEAPPLRFDI